MEPRGLLLSLAVSARERVAEPADLPAKHLQHRVRAALGVALLGLPHLAELAGFLDVVLLRLLELHPLLVELLREPRLLLLLLTEHRGHLQEHLEPLLLLGPGHQLLDLLHQLLPLPRTLR